MSLVFGGKYLVQQEIGYGGCGTVFHGVHHIAGKAVAIKVEPALTDAHAASPLRQEARLYRKLMGGEGVPWALWSGKHGDYNVLIIDRLGADLERLFKMCNRHFSLKTVLQLADQLISRIEYIHSQDLVHRDVKPANFVMGAGKTAGLVNVIDFGLAKRFRDPRTGYHIPYAQDGAHGVGTALFASLHTHVGTEASRRDDLESLAYMFIYFLRGTLPWRSIRGNSVAETWDLIGAKKREAEHLLTVGLPQEFDTFYKYARGLDFEDMPDYAGLRQLFRGLAQTKGIEYDGRFDWTVGKIRTRRRCCEACQANARQKMNT